MIDSFNFSCQGESHKSTEKPCQDYSRSHVTDNETGIAIVCDGHGGERYFRSQTGAELAAEVTDNAIWSFVQNVEPSLFAGKPYTAMGPNIPEKGDVKKPTNTEFIAFRQLFSNIIYRWNEKINEHAEKNPINEWEKSHVKETYIREFETQMSLSREDRTILGKTYGCTLMVYVQTPEYWFAFHLGDGKMIGYEIINGKVKWEEPVPWDDRCFLNKTTSLCDSDAIDEFRYCFEGDGKFPAAVFLGSDGLDDSFGEETNLVNFYIQIIKMVAQEGKDEMLKSLKETLPQLSKIGSKDDMSVASIFDMDVLKSNVQLFIDWQRVLVGNKIDEISRRIAELKEKRDNIEKSGKKDNNSVIELKYAEKDIQRIKSDRDRLIKTYNLFADELGDSHYPLLGNDSNEKVDDVYFQDAQQVEERKADSSNTEQNKTVSENFLNEEDESNLHPRNTPVTGD